MAPAFVTALPVASTASATPSLCTFDGLRKPATAAPAAPAVATVTMRCRRDLKKEKALRNLEFSRAHRKRPVRFFNRRAAQEATANEDNEFLSSLYGTIRFNEKEEENKGDRK